VGEVRFTAEIAASLTDVFAAHVDGPRIPEWFPGVVAIEDQSGPLDRTGATYRLRFNSLIASRCEVVAADPPRLHVRTWDARPIGTHGKATMRFFEEGAGRTRVDFHATYRLPFGPIGRLAGRLPGVRNRAERDMRREIDSFKDFAERGAGSPG
jgi:uncharacterized protein YndB with AHSA1/START domain